MSKDNFPGSAARPEEFQAWGGLSHPLSSAVWPKGFNPKAGNQSGVLLI